MKNKAMTKRITTLCLMLVLLGTASAASAQAPVCDYFSTNSLKDGESLNEGTVIEAYDADGIQAGYATVNSDGSFLIHVYGDDPVTADIDEGANEGEMLQWRLDGVVLDEEDVTWLGNVVGTFADLRYETGAAKEIQIDSSTTAVEETSWADVKRAFQAETRR